MDGLTPGDPPEIGGYRVLRRLGNGGMGVVYLAADPTGRLVAIKVIHPHLASDAGFRRRFTREVAAARRVARFCTAPVLDSNLEGDRAYLVTEYVEGPDLATAVRERGPLAGGNLEALAAGVAVALHAIHAAGVVHRDLKPSNVVLSLTGPRVIDFGIAQLVEPDHLPSQALLGTPAFMAPEQVRGEPVTPASDVFAWGGLVTYAGTGRLPFGAGPPAEVLYRVAHEGPALDDLDPRLRPLVERAMAKDPAARPAAQELLGALAGVAATQPAAATELVEQTWTAPLPTAPLPTAPLPATPPAAAPRPRRRWLVAAAAAAVLALVGGLALRYALAGDDPAPLPYQADQLYEVTSSGPGQLAWQAAPVGDVEDVMISVEAWLASGSGEFGIWCGGTDGPVRRYRFTLDDAGQAHIIKDVARGGPVPLWGPFTPPDTSLGAATDGWTRLTAQCRDTGRGLGLQMWVGDSAAGGPTDPGGQSLGTVGVYVLADAGGSATAQFRSFRVAHP